MGLTEQQLNELWELGEDNFFSNIGDITEPGDFKITKKDLLRIGKEIKKEPYRYRNTLIVKKETYEKLKKICLRKK